MARYLVPVVPPFVNQRVVRVRVGDEMGGPEQREGVRIFSFFSLFVPEGTSVGVAVGVVGGGAKELLIELC